MMKYTSETTNDLREQLWVEEAYLMYLNDYALESGLISDMDHDKMIRRIKQRTYDRERRSKEVVKKRNEYER